jgi:hypothetical protein
VLVLSSSPLVLDFAPRLRVFALLVLSIAQEAPCERRSLDNLVKAPAARQGRRLEGDQFNPNWNYDDIIQDAQIGFYAGLSIANTPQFPTWNPGTSSRRQGRRRWGRWRRASRSVQ